MSDFWEGYTSVLLFREFVVKLKFICSKFKTI